MTVDLAAWLLADDGPIAEDEREQQERLAGPDPEGGGPWGRYGPATVGRAPAGHPDRVLAECAAKRAIVDTYLAAREEGARRQGDVEFMNFVDGLGVAVSIMAGPHAGRPGWRDEWAA